MEGHDVDLFKRLLSVNHVKMVHIKKDASNIMEMDNSLRLSIYEDDFYKTMLNCLKMRLKHGCFMKLTDSFELTYFFIYVPTDSSTSDFTHFFCIGPMCNLRKSVEDISRIMTATEIPRHLLTDMVMFYSSVPAVEDIYAFENFVLQLASEFFETEYKSVYLPENESPFLTMTYKTKKILKDSEIARVNIEERYATENKILDAVCAGNYEEAHAAYQKFHRYYIPPRTDNLLLNKKNMGIVLSTLCRKASERGGVPPLYIDELSTKFAIAINEAASMQEMDIISNDIIHKYCLLVQNHSMRGYNDVTKKIVLYIDVHYMEDLNLAFFSDMFNLTKTYLSALFKKETGVTLTDFIHQTRMRKAMSLLNSTSAPISDIAIECGYNDINYFLRVFKRTYGLSPRQYQKAVIKKTAK